MIHPPSSIIPPGFASHALQVLQRVQLGISPVELIYTAHEHWPFQPGKTTHARPTLRISVLDSSFNPPTLAHLALANSLPPSSQPSSHHSPVSPRAVPAEPYDARILLLSIRNVDKVLKPGDANLVQRLEMMRLFSQDVHPTDSTGSSGKPSHMNGNIAIAVIDEPTFVGKSTVLLRFLQARLAVLTESHSPNTGSISGRQYTSYPQFPAPKLTFLLGFDTLIRLFSSKYYPSDLDMVQLLRTFLSQDQEDCHIVCAYRRSASKAFQETQDEFDVTHQFITSGRIAFIDIGAEEQTYSSSDVRMKVVTGDETWKRLVTNTVADYIIDQGLYSR